MWAAAVLPSITSDFTGITLLLSTTGGLRPPDPLAASLAGPPRPTPLRRRAPDGAPTGALRPDRETGRYSLGRGSRGRLGRVRLRRHVDGVTGALLEAGRTPGAEVEIDPIEPAFAELDDRLLGTCRVAVVALEAVAARETACRLVTCLALGQARDDFVEPGAFLDRQLGMFAPIGVEEDRQVE